MGFGSHIKFTFIKDTIFIERASGFSYAKQCMCSFCCPVPLTVPFPPLSGALELSFFRLMQLNPAPEARHGTHTPNKIRNENQL